MLKHEDSPVTQSPPAAQVRVTPEELALAIAALEAHKRSPDGTIAIGDAVEELSLDSDAEDILREVKAQRARKAMIRQRRKKSWIGLACALAAMGVMENVIHNRMLASPASRPTVPIVVSSQATLLSDVLDNQQVYVDTHGLRQIIGGEPSSQVATYSDSQGIRWSLIKHSGKTYLQAYTFPVGESRLTIDQTVIFNSEDHNINGSVGYVDKGILYEMVQVTLPVGAFRCQDSTQTEKHATLTVDHVHPDSHLWDVFTNSFAQ